MEIFKTLLLSFLKVFITLCIIGGLYWSYNLILCQYSPDYDPWRNIWGAGYLLGVVSFFAVAVMPVKCKGWKWWMSALFFIIFPALSYGLGLMIVKANSLPYGVILTVSLGMAFIIVLILAIAILTFLLTGTFMYLLAYFATLKGYTFKAKIWEIAKDCAKPLGIIIAILAFFLLLYWII